MQHLAAALGDLEPQALHCQIRHIRKAAISCQGITSEERTRSLATYGKTNAH